jgi:hypothetical protein
MTSDTSSAQSHRPPPAALLVVPLVVAIVLTLFAWPSAKAGPRDLPIGVAGPPGAAQALEQRLSAREGAFEIHRYPDEAAARAAIEDRDVYGAFAATPGGVKLLTASAASQPVAQLLANTARASGASPQVEDVVSAGPAGGAIASSVLPLLIAGFITAALCTALTPSAVRRAGLLVAGSILGGLVATGIAQGWLDVIRGDWVVNAAGLSLTIFAVAALIAGLRALFGHVGAIAGAVTLVLIGNPFAGVAQGPEMLPEPAGAIGQLMPPGAGGNLLRSTGYFDGAAAGGHIALLAAWALAGLALLAVAAVRGRRPAVVSAPVEA